MAAIQQVIFKLKSFTCDIQSHLGSIKQGVEGTVRREQLSDEIALKHAKSVQDNIENIETQLKKIEDNYFGIPEKRLGFLTLDEFNERLECLLNCNNALLQSVKKAHGIREITKILTPIKDSCFDRIENQENIPPRSSRRSSMNGNLNLVRNANRNILSEILINGDEGDIIIDETSASTPPRVSLQSQQSETPKLADWKLSSATRNFINGGQNDAIDVNPIICNRMEIASPSTPNVTPFKSLHFSISEFNSFPMTPDIAATLSTRFSEISHSNMDLPTFLDQSNNRRESFLHASVPFLQQISTDEWSHTPSFISSKITLEMLNKAMECINDIFFRDEIEMNAISQQILASHLCNYFGELTISSILLAAVYLKRLDTTTSDGTKYYKIRKV